MTAMSQPMQLLTSRATDEWYTPRDITDVAQSLLEHIDLDPASSPLPQQWIKANTYYTKDDDGMSLPWFGRVWLNPPFGDTARWVERLEAEYFCGNVTEALLLVNSNHGYKWYENLWRRWPVCCLRERVRFVNKSGVQGGQAKRGQTIVYIYQRDYSRFAAHFGALGRILFPYTNHRKRHPATMPRLTPSAGFRFARQHYNFAL